MLAPDPADAAHDSLRWAGSLNPSPSGDTPKSATSVHCVEPLNRAAHRHTSSWMDWAFIESWWSASLGQLFTSQCETAQMKKKINNHNVASPPIKKCAEPGCEEKKKKIFAPPLFLKDWLLPLNLPQSSGGGWAGNPQTVSVLLRGPDAGYGSAKVCYFSNGNQTMCLKQDVSSECWRGEWVFVSLENTSTCHEAYEK